MDIRVECDLPEDYNLGPIFEAKAWDLPLPTLEGEMVLVNDTTGTWLVERRTLAGDHMDMVVYYTGSVLITQKSYNWEITFKVDLDRGHVRNMTDHRKVKL